jgi:hypothetical protein
MAEKILTDSEKLDILNKRMKRVEISTHLQTAVVVIGFLGIVSLASLIDKLKHRILK